MFYEAWEEVLDLDGITIASTSTLLEIENLDGTTTRIIGVGLTYSGGLLVGGTVTGLERFDPETDTVLLSLTGGNEAVVDVLSDIQTVENVQADLASFAPFFDIDEAEDLSSFSNTLIEFTNEDGNTLQLIGNNFGPDEQNVDFDNAVVTELRVIDPNGVVLGTSGPVSYDLRPLAFGFDTTSADSYIINIAGQAATDIFVDDSYDSFGEFFNVVAGSPAKNFDLNGAGFFDVSYYEVNGIVADLAAGTVVRDGVTDTFTGNPDGFGLFEGSRGDDIITAGGTVFDAVYADEGDDSVTGSSGSDQIEGGAGDDTIEGLAGADSLFGSEFFEESSDNDTLTYANSNAGVDVNLETGSASGGHAQGDTIGGFANLTGSAFGDDLTGSDSSNVLRGEGGNDDISGGNSADALYGGAGGDTAYGGSGKDELFGGDGDDRLQGGNSGDTIYGGSDADTLSGNKGEDILKGGDGADFLYGGDSKDEIFGGGDNDVITGGNNHDDIRGQSGDDDIKGNRGNDVIRGGSGDDTIRGNDGRDTILGGDDNDDLRGGAGNDTVFGGNGDDELRGGGDNDILVSGLGTDVLEGGSGADVFVFNAVAESLNDATADAITDFARGEDMVDLSGLGDGLVFIGSAGFSGAGGEVRFTTTSTKTVIRADLDGDGSGEFKIDLDGVLGGINGLDLIL